MNKALLVILGVTLIALAACGGGAPQATSPAQTAGTPASAGVPPLPVIRLEADGTAYNGLNGAYCWLQAENDIRCEPEPLDPQPSPAVAVQAGQSVTFVVESVTGTPAALSATLLDDLDADGDQVVVAFGGTDSAAYTVELAPGRHRVSVLAEFPDVSGDNSFVTTLFALEVEPAVAAGLTPQPTRPTATSVLPTLPTEEAPKESPTPMGVQVTAVETEEFVAPTLPPPTLPPTTVPTATPLPPSPVAVTEVLPTLPPTPTTAAPSLPTAPPSTPTIAPTLLPPEGGEGFPPEVIVVNGGLRFTPSGTTSCYRAADGSQVCVDQPAQPDAGRILINVGDTIRLDAAQGGPLTMTLTLADNSLTETLQQVELIGSNVSLFTVTAGPGNYVLVVEAVWSEGTATYYFRLQVMS